MKSNCCNAPIEDTDICSQCKEHCEVVNDLEGLPFEEQIRVLEKENENK